MKFQREIEVEIKNAGYYEKQKAER